MAKGFFGKFRSAVCESRVRIPAKYKDLLGEDPYFAPSEDGSYFLLIPEGNLDDVLENYFVNDPFSNDKSRVEMRRLINDKMGQADVDSQGRLSLNSEIRDLCSDIVGGPEVIFAGAGKFIEVWPAATYDKRYGMKFDASQFGSMIDSLRATLDKKN